VLLSVELTCDSAVDEGTDVAGDGVVNEATGLGVDSVVDDDVELTGTPGVVTVPRAAVA
jgi:hypothetical protein